MSAESTRPLRPKTLVIGPMPPPHHGMALVLDALATLVPETERLDTAAGSIRADDPSFARIKIANCLRAAIQLVTCKKTVRRIVIAPDSGEGMFFTLLYVFLARTRRLQIYAQHHTTSYLDGSARLMHWICLVGGIRLTHIFLCPTAAETFATNHRIAGASVVAGNAYAVDQPQSDSHAAQRSGVVIGYLGNLSQAKGIDDFAKLVASTGDRPDWRFRLAGPATDAAADRAIQALSMDDRVAVLGPLGRDGVGPFLADLDVFVMPSLHEAMPLVISESLREGTPVIARSVGCIPAMGSDLAVKLVDEDQCFAEVAGSTISAWFRRPIDQVAEQRRSARTAYLAAAARDKTELLAVLS